MELRFGIVLKDMNAADRAKRSTLLFEVLTLSGNVGVSDHHDATGSAAWRPKVR
ncbi:Uncharacterised protein [Mycobacterium tuberculosis]|nr:Uncharacterised protein [Mycobacterium tuberculosis]